MALLFPTTHDLSDRVIGAAITVHRQLGPGLLESAYRHYLQFELTTRGIRCAAEVPIGISYRGVRLEEAYRIDLLVEDQLVVELKAVDKLSPIHTSQVVTYLKLGGFRSG